MESDKKILPGVVAGVVKWYDAKKGFGFIKPDSGDEEIMLHELVLRSSNFLSVSEGCAIKVRVSRNDRGLRAEEVVAVTVPEQSHHDHACFAGTTPPTAFVPARIKFYDCEQGFGFATMFGDTRDVYINRVTLRNSGLQDVQPGAAVSFVERDVGLLAFEIQPWLTQPQDDQSTDDMRRNLGEHEQPIGKVGRQ